MSKLPFIPSTHGTRFYHERQPYTYPYGNTPARNFLEYAHSDLKEPTVLVLGCGDVRSCFCTIWKNFDAHVEHRFEGVHFVLNDRSPSILARNILFIYLCIKLPEDHSSQLKYLCSMWSIWFCHELFPDHESLLRDALEVLLKYSVDESHWNNPNNPLHSLIAFFSPDTLSNIRNMWSMWYNREVDTSVQKMNTARQFLHSYRSPDPTFQAQKGLREACGLIGMDMCKNNFDTMTKEYETYLKTGNTFCESITETPFDPPTKRVINCTFFDRQDGTYTLHYNSAPFRCFQQKVLYNMIPMKTSGMHAPNGGIRISHSQYSKCPLLANSFQQFSAWMVGTAHVLYGNRKITFTVNSQDAFHFMCNWETKGKHKFDLVFASNVIDSVSPPAFILAAVRLLTENGLFLSATLKYRIISSNYSDYIEKTFGMSPDLLPVICGVRCLNHEGSKYSSPISYQHISVDIAEIDKTSMQIYESTIVWKKVTMTPIIPEMPPEICQALCNCFSTSCVSLQQLSPQKNYYICTDTAILILKEFASRVNTNARNQYQFWKGICAGLKEIKSLAPFLVSIQTQAIINGLHLHLLVDNSTCPLCKDLPISSYLRQCCIEINGFKFEDFLMIYLENASTIHYIDCISCFSDSSKVKVCFSVPLDLVLQGCNVTLVEYKYIFFGNTPRKILRGKLSSFASDTTSFTELCCSHPIAETTSSLGTIISHSGDGDAFETKILLSVHKNPALLSSSVCVETVSSHRVKIVCMNNEIVIAYPYQVYRIKVQRSKKSKSLTVLASRKAHQYEDEGQLFHVNPNDNFSLPPSFSGLDSALREVQANLHFSPNELQQLRINPLILKYCPLLKVKRTISFMLALTEDYFIRLQMADENDMSVGVKNLAIIKIINRVIDVERKAPALDMYICFLDELNETDAKFIEFQLECEYMTSAFYVQNFPLDQAAYNICKAIFVNFCSHTMQCRESYPLVNNRPSLTKCGIQQFFKRAVVYPLYRDRDIAGNDISSSRRSSEMSMQPSDPHLYPPSDQYHAKSVTQAALEVSKEVISHEKSSLDNCAYCHKKSPDLKSCGKCRKAMYCGRECQRAHWKKHKHFCVPPVEGEKQKPECSSCGKATSDLKKCTGCKKVSYCSKQCQTSHWSQHKSECKSSSKTNNSTTSSSLKSEQNKTKTIVALTPNSQTLGADQKCDLNPNMTNSVYAEQEVKQQMYSVAQSSSSFTQLVSKNSECGYCGKMSVKPQRCGRCHKVFYCGLECQRAHWKEHKPTCTK